MRKCNTTRNGHSRAILSRSRRIILLACLSCVVLGTPSCNRPGTLPRQDVKFQLDWKPGAEHAFLYLGKEKGFFEKAGINLEIVPSAGSSESANMVNGKSVEFALCSGESAFAARSAVEPRRIIAVAVFYPSTPTVIYSLKAKGIVKPEDLYGKRLGVMKTSSAYRNFVAFARKIGLDRSRITEVASTGDLREIVAGNASLDAMVHFEFQHPLLLKLRGDEVSVIRLRDHGLTVYGQSLITHVDTAEHRPELVEALTHAVQRSYVYCIEHPEEALEVFLKNCPEQDADYSKAKLEWINDFVSSGVPAGKPIGTHDHSGWAATKEYLTAQGLLERDVAVEEFATTRFLDPAIRLKP